MTVFVAWFDFSTFGCMHNVKQMYDCVIKGSHLPPGTAF